MSREVPFDSESVCDGCGALGAFDFCGDYLCPACIADPDPDPTILSQLIERGKAEVSTPWTP